MATPSLRKTQGSRKDELTQLAIEMMQSRGFSALGMRELADAAGLRPPSLYNHFTSKDEISRAALASYSARHRDELQALSSAAGLSGAARIRIYAERCGACLREDRRFCLFLVLTTNSHDLSADAVRDIAALVEEQGEWLAGTWDEGRTDGSIASAQDGAVAGPMLFAALRGIMAFATLKADAHGEFNSQMKGLLDALGVA